MRFYSNVIARKGKKYWIGKVKRMKFVPEEELNSLETLDKLGIRYITLYEYAKIIGLGLTKTEVDDLRKKIGYTEIWVYDELPHKNRNINDAAWERWFWRFVNPLCKDCVRECKQSSRVSLYCPKFEKKS